jgi:hypothetical protein
MWSHYFVVIRFGKVSGLEEGTLEYAIEKKNRFSNLVDNETGSWATSSQVRNVAIISPGSDNETFEVIRNEWLTVSGDYIGPDLQIGQVLEEAMPEEPILLLKSCQGNRALGWDILPPGSQQFEAGEYVYPGYGESPRRWIKGTEPVPSAWYAGKQYDLDLANAKRILADLSTYYPGATEYEITGFMWWQGYKDTFDAVWASRYEANLVQLIKSLRTDFNAPDAKFSIATVAFEGSDMAGLTLEIALAQLAVGNGEKYPEFAGTVKTADVRWSWRNTGPSNEGSHYYHNAETYMEVGDALGQTMVDLSSSVPTSTAPSAGDPTFGPTIGSKKKKGACSTNGCRNGFFCKRSKCEKCRGQKCKESKTCCPGFGCTKRKCE